MPGVRPRFILKYFIVIYKISKEKEKSPFMTSLFTLLQLYSETFTQMRHLVASQTSMRNYIPIASKIANSRSTTAHLISNLLQWEHTAPGHYDLLTIILQREKTQSCYEKKYIYSKCSYRMIYLLFCWLNLFLFVLPQMSSHLWFQGVFLRSVRPERLLPVPFSNFMPASAWVPGFVLQIP